MYLKLCLTLPSSIFSAKKLFPAKTRQSNYILFTLSILVPAIASVFSLDFRPSPSLPFPLILKTYGVSFSEEK
jgi:hypothetical protein